MAILTVETENVLAGRHLRGVRDVFIHLPVCCGGLGTERGARILCRSFDLVGAVCIETPKVPQ